MTLRGTKAIESWQGQSIPPGETVDLRIKLTERRTGGPVRIPVQVRRGKKDGPVVFVTGALHGDEINGTGAIHHLLVDSGFEIQAGAIVLIPVLNMLGFERHSRYLPDRRDLNRSFPGSTTGSLASRIAYRVSKEIVDRCDFGIDLHSASVRRTNYPHVRADLSGPETKRIAVAFGCEVILDGPGPEGSLRNESFNRGCATIVMEGGEVSKVEPGVIESTLRGIRNVLVELEMIEGELEHPRYTLVIRNSTWLRARRGGYMYFHVSPGDLVDEDQPIATVYDLLGKTQDTIVSPCDAVVIGMTTLPAVSPGEPICHLGQLSDNRNVDRLKEHRVKNDALEGRLVDQLSSNVNVVDPEEM